jgi:uncharacterized protein (TIGR04255 family)
VLLTNNRIEAAVAEVRFLGAEKEQFSSDDATAMLAELSERTAVTRLETAEQRELSFSFVGGDPEPSVEVTSRGWRFSSADENQLFTLLPNIAIVQVRGYERWSTSLRPQLEAMLATTVQHAAPTIVQRLGLRYINRLVGTPGEPPQAWARRIAPAFHGPLAEPTVGRLLRGAHQQLELALEPDVGAIIRHGLVPNPADDEFGYLVDLDVFDTRSKVFSVDEVVNRVQRLNRTAARLFQLMLTEEQVDNMDPIAIDITQPEGDLT